MKIYVDIDDTIAFNDSNPMDYSQSKPIVSNINRINELYDEGHEITYYTARGSVTGVDWTELTTKQLDEWGCKRHALKLGKPPYDVLIDDKALNARVWEQKGNSYLTEFKQDYSYSLQAYVTATPCPSVGFMNPPIELD